MSEFHDAVTELIITAGRVSIDLPVFQAEELSLAISRATNALQAAQSQAPKLCGCADAERTYEQLLDYTAELGNELDRQRVIVRAAEALVECDAAKPGLGQSISVWRRQRRELLDTLAAAVRALLEGEKQ